MSVGHAVSVADMFSITNNAFKHAIFKEKEPVATENISRHKTPIPLWSDKGI